MPNINYVMKLMRPIIDDLKQDLTDKPFFIVTEADLQGYIYSKLLSKDVFKMPFLDQKERENFMIHLEFPRYYDNKGKIRKKGRYDVAILRKDRFDEVFTGGEDLLDKRRVEVGFELKLNWDSRARTIIPRDFDLDIPAFENKDKSGNRKIVADLGVMINVNVATDGNRRSSATDLSDLRAKVETLRGKSEATVPLLFIYLESYRKKGEEPREMTVPAYK